MRLTVTQAFLSAALAKGAAVVSKNNPIVVLSHVRLVATDGKLAVASTDLTRFAEATIDAEIAEAGAITVPGQAFVTLVNKHPKAGEISLEVEGGSLVVKCGRSKVKLPSLPIDDFPGWADDAPVAEFEMTAQGFAQAFNRTRFAASQEETRYYLMGVHLHVDGDALKLAATDGFRMAVASVPLPEGAEDLPANVIVPSEAIDAALSIFKSAEEIHVAFTDKSVSFQADGLRLCSKLIDGSFPDYRRVIPAPGGASMTLKRADLVDCLDRANVLAGDGAYSAIVASPGPGSLLLRAANGTGGEAVEELPAVIEGDFKRWGFNPRFAAAFLGALPVDELMIEQIDPDGPHRLTSPQAPDFVGVLMPMRVSAA